MAAVGNEQQLTELRRRLQAAIQTGQVSADDILAELYRISPELRDVPPTPPPVPDRGIYKKFEASDIVEGRKQLITYGLWTGNTGSLQSFWTGSQTTGSSGYYYYDVYNANPMLSSSAELQFSIAYGHIDGGGSVDLSTNSQAKLYSQVTYTQYRNILLESSGARFNFYGTDTIDDIYVINMARTRFKEEIDPGNWELVLATSTGSIHLIDDSITTDARVSGFSGRHYYIVSGTLNLGSDSSASIHSESYPTSSGYYGAIWPDVGIMILNPAALSLKLGNPITPVTASDAEYLNQKKLLTALQSGSSFQGRSAENISSTHYFVRARSREFNFSNNPTFYTASDGAFTNPSYYKDPKVFITTIGLFDDDNELLAVAKLNRPIMKSFDTEALIRIKLDF